MKSLKIITETIKYILIGIMLIIFTANFYVMIMSAINPNSHPDVFGYSVAVVVSGSMHPAIDVDDVIVIKEQKEYQKDDIIAFSTGKSLVTHRIIEVTPQGFVTKGDANNTADSQLVQVDNISGEVVYIIPKVGSAIYFLRSPLGMLLIMALAFVMMLTLEKKEKKD